MGGQCEEKMAQRGGEGTVKGKKDRGRREDSEGEVSG